MATVAERPLTELNQVIDELGPAERVRYLFVDSDDRIIYIFGFLAAIWQISTNGMSLAGLLVTTAYADSGILGHDKNFIALLIFLAFILSLAGAIFARGAGRRASESFAKLLAGGLVGFVGGSKA